ncbi:hypothetical protein [Novosphingobium sp. Fuku2-ISO-50]|uniref:hypothetical protein n=1 Tax=Novosphingobium sp. Fuku2-ISO-50 TaxID=1739114 RepID=UPI001E3D61B3|nr:hypothetical protein [Novosphingobium sp. Fuku2-ISO-50]
MPKVSSAPFTRSALMLAFMLAGCGGATTYPSLAQRPAERAFIEEAAATAPITPQASASPDSATVGHVESLRADAARAAQEFAHRAQEADDLSKAARGTGVGSEAWAAATTAMAALDSARSDTALPLADLDALMVGTAVSAAQSGGARGAATYAVIARADSDVAAMLADEDARIAALQRAAEN